ncbi:hypothetical protein MJO28_006867 [Puccinia striiformis f. sp. tritici]|uniref:Uncharacterized protein n=1 Tax=Puccinia striiformis f. sp. tritici TaxID=168172 RepID=A0ACC0EC84_9BASI|nr:hypothetical protein Pst134EB_013988 [Puccinia striiformis f. sp. tritici]KAI7951183.1 hypothetical protein MJO28_006867 [Puccinia striiformis f. sp. tritici]
MNSSHSSNSTNSTDPLPPLCSSTSSSSLTSSSTTSSTSSSSASQSSSSRHTQSSKLEQEEHPLIGTTVTSTNSNRTKYHLTRILGKGSFSNVFQAKLKQHSSSSSTVALKLIRITTSTTSVPQDLITQDQMPTDEAENVRMSTLREIEILKSIDHPTIIKLIETFSIPSSSSSSLQVIVLEELRGGELFDLVSKFKSNLRPLIIARLMAELSISIHWLHSHHIVHRDLKLENILLVRQIKNTPEEEEEDILRNPSVYLKVTDFGLSVKLTKTNDSNNSVNGYKYLQSRCGSEEYAAPEIILGREYDGTKTDAWALGVIGYSLLMGILPFKLPTRNSIGLDDDEQSFLKKRKQALLKIIKSEYRWNLNPTTTNTHLLNHLTIDEQQSIQQNPIQAHITLVDRLLIRDPLKRSNDLLLGFRDPNWLGKFTWLKDSLLPLSSDNLPLPSSSCSSS